MEMGGVEGMGGGKGDSGRGGGRGTSWRGEGKWDTRREGGGKEYIKGGGNKGDVRDGGKGMSGGEGGGGGGGVRDGKRGCQGGVEEGGCQGWREGGIREGWREGGIRVGCTWREGGQTSWLLTKCIVTPFLEHALDIISFCGWGVRKSAAVGGGAPDHHENQQDECKQHVPAVVSQTHLPPILLDKACMNREVVTLDWLKMAGALKSGVASVLLQCLELLTLSSLPMYGRVVQVNTP